MNKVPTTGRIVLAVLLAVDTALTALIAYGLGKLRIDFQFWQRALFRIDQRPRRKVFVDDLADKPLDECSLLRWLRQHRDRPQNTTRHCDVCIRPNRPGPNRVEGRPEKTTYEAALGIS
jgi:hypothetical protein